MDIKFVYRLKFSKTGNLRFIGHLDLLKVFQATIRRSMLPVAYSQGFNPHLHLSFALPVPLGMESVHDYADMTLTEASDHVVDALNAMVPDGLWIHSAKLITSKAAAALVQAADYQLSVGSLFATDDVKTKISRILAQKECFIMKKTKSGIKNTDIRPDIYDVQYDNGTIWMRLAAGSGRFLNPMIAAELILGQKPSVSDIKRLELYQCTENNQFVPL